MQLQSQAATSTFIPWKHHIKIAVEKLQKHSNKLLFFFVTFSETGLMVWSKPTQFSSTILRAFWKASSKLRPIAITSPVEKTKLVKICHFASVLMQSTFLHQSIQLMMQKMIWLLLTNTLHGAANLGGDPEELAEIPARHLHHTVVQTRLKVGCCRVGHRIPTESKVTYFLWMKSHNSKKVWEILKKSRTNKQNRENQKIKKHVNWLNNYKHHFSNLKRAQSSALFTDYCCLYWFICMSSVILKVKRRTWAVAAGSRGPV